MYLFVIRVFKGQILRRKEIFDIMWRLIKACKWTNDQISRFHFTTKYTILRYIILSKHGLCIFKSKNN